MARTKDLRRELIGKIEKLSEEQLAEALNYIQSLLKQRRRKASRTSSLNPKDDPFLKCIGSIPHDSLATNIDEELYGR